MLIYRRSDKAELSRRRPRSYFSEESSDPCSDETVGCDAREGTPRFRESKLRRVHCRFKSRPSDCLRQTKITSDAGDAPRFSDLPPVLLKARSDHETKKTTSHSKLSHSRSDQFYPIERRKATNFDKEWALSKNHGSKHRSSKASHSKTEKKIWTLFEGPMKNPKQELLLSKKHSSKSRNSKASHSKTESKLLTLTKKHSKHTQKDHSESLRQVRCHHQRSNPSSQCVGCQPAYLDVASRHFDALAALYSPDFIYPDSSVEVLDNVETFIARLERFGNVDRPRQKERSSGRN